MLRYTQTALLILCLGGCGDDDSPQWSLGSVGKGDTGDSIVPVTLHEIPLLKQADPRWGKKRLFNSNKCRTIAVDGCVLTSLAMLNNYYGDPRTPEGLNTCIADNGGHSGCFLDMPSIDASCLAPGMEHHGQIWKNRFYEMRTRISMGNPLLARVSRSETCGPENTGGHTVLVTGWEGSGTQRKHFRVHDPGNGEIRKLSAFPKLCFLHDISWTHPDLLELNNTDGL